MEKSNQNQQADLALSSADTQKNVVRGFAAMNEERQREIASMGGKAAHERGNVHEFTPEEAREAGRKSGQAVSQNRQHMSEIGRIGGKARHGAQHAHHASS